MRADCGRKDFLTLMGVWPSRHVPRLLSQGTIPPPGSPGVRGPSPREAASWVSQGSGHLPSGTSGLLFQWQKGLTHLLTCGSRPAGCLCIWRHSEASAWAGQGWGRMSREQGGERLGQVPAPSLGGPQSPCRPRGSACGLPLASPPRAQELGVPPRSCLGWRVKAPEPHHHRGPSVLCLFRPE